jgi:hypothetical protein
MANYCAGLLHGMVWETRVGSITGDYLYSDFATGRAEKDTTLNTLVKIPFLGIVAGVARVALALIHTVGHFLAALLTRKKGHLFHVAKGVCEALRGVIESIPGMGRVFTNFYSSAGPYDYEGARSWWMIKIYNPERPDGLDAWMNHWATFPRCFRVAD